ncbi:hypothetical protein pipiens_020419, partial [Culex pipiens pipiens]
ASVGIARSVLSGWQPLPPSPSCRPTIVIEPREQNDQKTQQQQQHYRCGQGGKIVVAILCKRGS